MESLIDAMTAAEEISDKDTYIKCVKRAFAGKVRDLDPSASVEDTGYFNHSAIPDFMLKWNGEGEHRRVYLRRSFDEIEAGHDLEHFDDQDSVVVSLHEKPGSSVPEGRIREHVSKSKSSLLVTGGLALDKLAQGGDSRADSSLPRSPLDDLLARQVMRGGRGLIDAERADLLVRPNEDLSAAIRENFADHTAQVVIDTVDLINATLDADASLPESQRQLSAGEAATILPWIFSHVQQGQDSPYWASLGARLSLPTLEEISDRLAGIDLSPLVRQSWHIWRGRRGYLGLNVNSDESGWTFRNGNLTFLSGSQALSFASDGRSFRGRGAASSATWDGVSNSIPSGIEVTSTTLRGVDRTVTLTSEGKGRIFQDIRRIVESLEVTMYVDELKVQMRPAGPEEDASQIAISFGDSLVVCQKGASIYELAECISKILAYRDQIDLDGDSH